MGAFELQDTPIPVEQCLERAVETDRRRVKDECIVAYKVYDSCRRQNCLTPREIGPARAAKETTIGDTTFHAGEFIRPPAHAGTVTMDNVRISKIHVVDKQPCPFRTGFWDVSIKYVFEYRLTFREVGGKIIEPQVEANSFFNMKVTLFGSVGGDLVIATDMHNKSDGTTFDAAPFIWIEAKALSLDSRISDQCGGEVHVTLGLFSILKLFRLVHLNVQSKGFCIPDECQDQGDINPCEYFADLDFPMDIFAPPQRPEFVAGISENIPRVGKHRYPGLPVPSYAGIEV